MEPGFLNTGLSDVKTYSKSLRYAVSFYWQKTGPPAFSLGLKGKIESLMSRQGPKKLRRLPREGLLAKETGPGLSYQIGAQGGTQVLGTR